MFKDITIGQYIPGKSIFHNLDPRVKIICIFTCLILVFCTYNYISLFVMFLVTVLFMLFSGIRLKMYFKSMKFIFFIVAFTSILNLFYSDGDPIFKLGFITITKEGIDNSIFVCVRVISLVVISSILTFTTTPTDLTDALERLLKPLEILKVNVAEIAMMMTIALRFIPTLLEETDKIIIAQKSRGADLETGNITQRVKSLIPIIIPLFVSSFRRAYDLAIAMECRCYKGGEGRSRMKILKTSKVDLIMIFVVIIICMGVIVCNIRF